MVQNKPASLRTRVTVRGAARRQEILSFVARYAGEHQRTPSIREIAQATKLTTNTVSYHLEGLADAGEIRWDRGISRGIVLLDQPHVVGAQP